jgi:hypothetical protein
MNVYTCILYINSSPAATDDFTRLNEPTHKGTFTRNRVNILPLQADDSQESQYATDASNSATRIKYLELQLIFAWERTEK